MHRLELVDISKQYPAVKANDRVSLRVKPGEIHAVLGENGAGKSTLMKIIYGAVRPDEGEIRWNGEPVQIASPAAARALGISMVYQHFSLFDTLTAAENVWLGLDKSLSLAEVIARIRKVAGVYGLDVDPLRPVHTLSVGEKQRVEIVRALMTAPKLLILDEPTSVLTPQAVQTLFVTLRKLADEGCSILYICHKLDEIRALCHHCTVLRGGRVTGEVDPTKETNASLSRLMIGAEPPQLLHREPHPGHVVLAVHELSLAKEDPFGTALDAISFQVRAGEVVGIAGVSGNGQQELMAAISGEDRARAGALDPAVRARHRPRIAASAPRLGPALRSRGAPRPRRRADALAGAEHAADADARRSASAAGSNVKAITALAEDLIRRFNVKAGGPGSAAKSLSGGNLQKFIVGREIDAAPKLLVVSQPTWGVDVGAAAQIRGELLALRDAGCAVLVVSEELDELFEICDRLVVIARGRVSPSVPTGAGDDRADRRVDERPVGPRAASASHAQA